MRIAILSLILNTNYGGILQAYALQTILERMGHQVKVIDRESMPEISVRQRFTELPKRFLQKYVLRKQIDLWPEQHYRHLKYRERSSETRKFIFRNIHLRKCNVLNRLRSSEFDAIVVGSDQVWRPSYFIAWGHIRNAYLAFASKWNIKRISYAASFGTDNWEYDGQQTAEVRNLITLFDAVSVREAGAVRLCKDKLNTDATHVLDPTLLLDRQYYENLIQQTETPPVSGTLLNYILDDSPEKSSLIETIAKDKNLTPFRINETESTSSDLRRKPVEYWLKAFRDAEFIVTDSFHACVFSVIFHKPFICVGNKKRGLSRFQIFTDNLCLSSNIINDINEYSSSFNYAPKPKTYSKLEDMKQQSMSFLITHL